MKKKLLLLTSTLLLASCQSIVVSSTSESLNSTTSGENSTFVEQTTSSEEQIVIPEGYYELCEGVYVSQRPGVYSNKVKIEFFVTNENYELYYTLDNRVPPIHSYYLYNGNYIEIDSYDSQDISDYPLTRAVDAILPNDYEGKCVSIDYNINIQTNEEYYLLPLQTIINLRVYDLESESDVLNRSLSYIIDKEGKYSDIPVVSLSMPYTEWFGTNGFYNKIRENIEKRVNLEFYDPVYDEYFYRNSQIKLGGNWSLGYPQRTLNLNFNKDQNGKKNKPVTEHVFGERMRRDGEGRLTKITRFRLHNGGNCFEEFTGLNDALLQTIMEDGYGSTTAYRPCIAYLNGEYWGIYSLREHYKDSYVENNYGIDKDNVIFYEYKGQYLIEDGDEVIGEQLINELQQYVTNNDFTKDEVYQKFIDEYIDEDSFIDVFLANAYSCNWDFVGNWNNLKLWRSITKNDSNPYEDGKWRFCFHDSDFAFREDVNYLDVNHQHTYAKYDIFRSLMNNEQFKEKFYARAEYLILNNFSEQNSSNILTEMIDNVYNYKHDSAYRWGKKDSYFTYWHDQINYVYNYFKTKSSSFLKLLRDTMKQY